MSLIEWLFTNQQSLPDGIYKTDEFGHVFCSGMMLNRPSACILKSIKGLESYDVLQ